MFLPPEHIAPDGRLTCMVCKQPFHRLATHVSLKHGVSPDVYRERYGLNRTAPLSSAAVRYKFSIKAKEQGLAALATPITSERRRTDPRLRRPARQWRAHGRANLVDAKTGRHFSVPRTQEACKDCGTPTSVSISNAGRTQGVRCPSCRAKHKREQVRAWKHRRTH